ncbi:MAG: hypothetical protein M1828_002011 [Chrysothrix sp. TS-e1954]|nr:MAG: hypothetical protein M1828_002011 [Chrysothrix sp. TS-e1954]
MDPVHAKTLYGPWNGGFPASLVSSSNPEQARIEDTSVAKDANMMYRYPPPNQRNWSDIWYHMPPTAFPLHGPPPPSRLRIPEDGEACPGLTSFTSSSSFGSIESYDSGLLPSSMKVEPDWQCGRPLAERAVLEEDWHRSDTPTTVFCGQQDEPSCEASIPHFSDPSTASELTAAWVADGATNSGTSFVSPAIKQEAQDFWSRKQMPSPFTVNDSEMTCPCWSRWNQQENACWEWPGGMRPSSTLVDNACKESAAVEIAADQSCIEAQESRQGFNAQNYNARLRGSHGLRAACKTYEKSRSKEEFLVESRRSGMSYKEIRTSGNFEEAESTLRGRFRVLTKEKHQRVRRPAWTDNDLRLLTDAVAKLRPKTGPSHRERRIPWQKVAERIAHKGGSYFFGNATCRKKWDEIQRVSN